MMPILMILMLLTMILGNAADDVDEVVVIDIDVAINVIASVADTTARIPLASTWEIQVPSISIMITCIEINKYAAASSVYHEDLPGVSQEYPSSVGLFVSSKMALTVGILTSPVKAEPPS